MHIGRFVVVQYRAILLHNEHRHSASRNLGRVSLRSGKKLKVEEHERQTASKLSLAFTYRQLYYEVTPLYYRENTF